MTDANYICSMCGVSFQDVAAHRQHAKSEWHVYRLRCRVSEPGTEIPPPSAPEYPEADIDATSTRTRGKAPCKSDSENASEEDESDDFASDEDGENDEDDDTTAPEFEPGQCLFCNSMLSSFNGNLEHMRVSHSFKVPYEDHLSVDLETFIWYLHMVVHAYRECLSCGTRKGSIEGAKQHMVARGHCRVDVAGDIADFYSVNYPRSDGQIDGTHVDGSALRLSSGKVLGSRSDSSQSRPRNKRAGNSMTAAIAEPSQAPYPQDSRPRSTISSGSKAVQKQARRADAMTVALGQLRASDQMSLAHLSSSEQRSLLATRKKQLSKVQREQRRAQSRVERLGNRTLMRHFKPDVPGRLNG